MQETGDRPSTQPRYRVPTGLNGMEWIPSFYIHHIRLVFVIEDLSIFSDHGPNTMGRLRSQTTRVVVLLCSVPFGATSPTRRSRRWNPRGLCRHRLLPMPPSTNTKTTIVVASGPDPQGRSFNVILVQEILPARPTLGTMTSRRLPPTTLTLWRVGRR